MATVFRLTTVYYAYVTQPCHYVEWWNDIHCTANENILISGMLAIFHEIYVLPKILHLDRRNCSFYISDWFGWYHTFRSEKLLSLHLSLILMTN